MNNSRRRLRLGRCHVMLALSFLLYLGLTCYQLGLPGLHYDEAREAGVNAMELLTGAPVTLFRDSGITLFGRQWPLMVQDYIGALNVYLSLPFLWFTGIGVPNLRFLAIFLGFITLLLVERTISEYIALASAAFAMANRPGEGVAQALPANRNVPTTTSGLIAVLLLAASPSFVFWSRQGIFVTNLTQPLTLGCLWLGLRWLRHGRLRDLLWSAFLGSAALYAKLLAIWMIAPFVLLAGGWWLWQRRTHSNAVPRLTLWQWIVLPVVFILPLLPLLWFNLQSGGTVSAIGANWATSYYGVDNLAIGSNIMIRLGQLRQVLTGTHFWYLGGSYGNPLAIWGGGAIVLIALVRRPRMLLLPLLLLLASFAASLFTISDLFITHYALLQPVLISVIALAIALCCVERGSTNFRPQLGIVLVALWLLLDLTATVRYHGALTRSGGLADHSDAGYHLAYYLRYNGLGAPIALDWGFDAPVRFLSEGTVTPIEIFGYDAVSVPDDGFGARVQTFLDNPNNVYLLHTPQATVFAGRRERFLDAVAQQGLTAQLETTFAQRDGTPLYEVWRVMPPSISISSTQQR